MLIPRAYRMIALVVVGFIQTAVGGVPARPNPDTELGLGSGAGTLGPIACNTDADCEVAGLGTFPNVNCVPAPDGAFPGSCYVSASRYLSVLPNAANTDPTARRITLDLNENGVHDPGVDHVLGWVGAPLPVHVTGPEASPQAQARIVDTPVFRNWNDLSDIDPSFVGDAPVRLGDCEVSPGKTAGNTAKVGNAYFIQAIKLGDDTDDEARFSSPLRLRTTTLAGDVSGTGLGSNYPNGSAGLADVYSIVRGFKGVPLIPKWRLDQAGGAVPGNDDTPTIGTVSLNDIFDAAGAFQSGGNYIYSEPCDCMGQACPPKP